MRINGFKVISLSVLTLATIAVALQAAGEDKTSDGDFVKKASSSGLAEVKAGELALQKSTDTKIKTLAQKMIDDHRRINRELETLAKQKGWFVSKIIDEQGQRELDLLAGATAQEFDRRYIEVQLKAHDNAVKLFEAEVKGGQDESLKNWANKVLPSLRDHLQMAKELSERKDR